MAISRTRPLGRPAIRSRDVATRLNNAKVQLDPNESYGLTVVGDNIAYNPFKYDNGLLGAKQVGNNLLLTSFAYYNGGGDEALGQASITLGLCADAACSNAPQ